MLKDHPNELLLSWIWPHNIRVNDNNHSKLWIYFECNEMCTNVNFYAMAWVTKLPQDVSHALRWLMFLLIYSFFRIGSTGSNILRLCISTACLRCSWKNINPIDWCMDRHMDGCMDRNTDRETGRQTSIKTNRLTDQPTDELSQPSTLRSTNQCTNWQADRKLDRQTDGQTDGWMDGWMDQWIDGSIDRSINWSIDWLTNQSIDLLMDQWMGTHTDTRKDKKTDRKRSDQAMSSPRTPRDKQIAPDTTGTPTAVAISLQSYLYVQNQARYISETSGFPIRKSQP